MSLSSNNEINNYKTFVHDRYEELISLSSIGWGSVNIGKIPGNVHIEFDGIIHTKRGGSAEDGIFDSIAIGDAHLCALGGTNADHLAYRCDNGWGAVTTAYNTYDRHVWALENNSDGMKILVDGTQVWSSSYRVASEGLDAFIFGQYRGSVATVYSAKVLSNNTLYMNLVPGYDLVDKKYGLLDKLNMNFYPFVDQTKVSTYVRKALADDIYSYDVYNTLIQNQDGTQIKNYKSILYQGE